MNRRGQTDTGPLQQLMIVVILVAACVTGALMFFNGLSQNYGVALGNETAFAQFNESFEDVSTTSQNLSDQILESEGGTDIILVMLTGGFKSLIDLLLGIPAFIVKLFTYGLTILGLGEFIPYITVGVLVVVIFAILAIIMKVRA